MFSKLLRGLLAACISEPGVAHGLANPGDLLKSSVVLAATVAGAGFSGVHHLGLWRDRRPHIFLAFAGLLLFVLGWFVSIRASHDRNWRPETAVLPRTIVDGDRVRLANVRNFEYRSKDDFTVRGDISLPPPNIPRARRALFLIYLDRINELADKPEFYNLLRSS